MASRCQAPVVAHTDSRQRRRACRILTAGPTMPTGKPFSVRTSLRTLAPALDSIGVHLAAKLAAFASDERTLTDELCDMLCIWAAAPHAGVQTSYGLLPGNLFDLSLAKTTTGEEVRTGADLE